MFAARNIHYEMADCTRAVVHGGISKARRPVAAATGMIARPDIPAAAFDLTFARTFYWIYEIIGGRFATNASLVRYHFTRLFLL